MDGATITAPFSERLAALVLRQTEDIKVLLLCLHFHLLLTPEAHGDLVPLPIEAGAPSANWASVDCPTAARVETDVNHFDIRLMPATKHDKPPEIGIPYPLCTEGHRGGSQPRTPAKPFGTLHGTTPI